MAMDYPHASQGPDGAFTADRHLYLDATQTVVVEEGDARSAYQFVAKGHVIAQADADRLGLSVDEDGRVVLPGTAPAEPVTSESEEEPTKVGDAPPSAPEE